MTPSTYVRKNGLTGTQTNSNLPLSISHYLFLLQLIIHKLLLPSDSYIGYKPFSRLKYFVCYLLKYIFQRHILLLIVFIDSVRLLYTWTSKSNICKQNKKKAGVRNWLLYTAALESECSSFSKPPSMASIEYGLGLLTSVMEQPEKVMVT